MTEIQSNEKNKKKKKKKNYQNSVTININKYNFS